MIILSVDKFTISKMEFYKQLTPTLWFGNAPQGIVHANVIINIGIPLKDGNGKPYSKCIQVAVPDIELLDSEMQKIIKRLNDISAFITTLGKNNVYIHSSSNIQGLLLLAGYHMVKTGVWNTANVVEKLDTINFSSEDHDWEKNNCADLARALEKGDLTTYSELSKAAPKRIFTSNSFRKILISI